jgi:hypothetical protein
VTIRPLAGTRCAGAVSVLLTHYWGMTSNADSEDRLPLCNDSTHEQNSARDLPWFRRADELVAFCTEHGRRPSQRSCDGNEKTLGRWLVQQRTYAKGSSGASALTPQRRAYLDQHIPGWDVPIVRDWSVVADELIAFCAEHGRWPSSKSTDTRERSLGMWLVDQRKHAKGGPGASALTPQRRAYLDQHIPGWEIARRRP